MFFTLRKPVTYTAPSSADILHTQETCHLHSTKQYTYFSHSGNMSLIQHQAVQIFFTLRKPVTYTAPSSTYILHTQETCHLYSTKQNTCSSHSGNLSLIQHQAEQIFFTLRKHVTYTAPSSTDILHTQETCHLYSTKQYTYSSHSGNMSLIQHQAVHIFFTLRKHVTYTAPSSTDILHTQETCHLYSTKQYRYSSHSGNLSLIQHQAVHIFFTLRKPVTYTAPSSTHILHTQETCHLYSTKQYTYSSHSGNLSLIQHQAVQIFFTLRKPVTYTAPSSTDILHTQETCHLYSTKQYRYSSHSGNLSLIQHQAVQIFFTLRKPVTYTAPSSTDILHTQETCHLYSTK